MKGADDGGGRVGLCYVSCLVKTEPHGKLTDSHRTEYVTSHSIMMCDDMWFGKRRTDRMNRYLVSPARFWICLSSYVLKCMYHFWQRDVSVTGARWEHDASETRLARKNGKTAQRDSETINFIPTLSMDKC